MTESPLTWTRTRRAGFTLLEVMVAVAILALALTSIFSSQVGAVRIANRARRTHVATLLARCKMGEIEENVANRGLPAIDDRGSDRCCEHAEVEGYTCDWVLDRVILPEMASGGGLGGGEGDDDDDEGGGGLDVMSMVSGGGMTDGFTRMALELSYPSLKPALEEQVRRASVTVKWNEGRRPMSFDVVQYLVGEVGEAPLDPLEMGAQPGTPGAQPGTPGAQP